MTEYQKETNEKEVIVNINITDWDEEYRQKERQVYNQDDIIDRLKDGVKPMELARNIIAARERGLTDPNIIKSNKLTLNIGGMFQVCQVNARRHKDINTVNGSSINVRETVCQNGDDDPKAVDSKSEKGCQRATNYLKNAAIGHIKSRLNIIAINQGASGIKEIIAWLMAELQSLEAELLGKLE